MGYLSANHHTNSKQLRQFYLHMTRELGLRFVMRRLLFLTSQSLLPGAARLMRVWFIKAPRLIQGLPHSLDPVVS